MNKRQRKKARRKQIRIYTQLGAIPGPFRSIKQAIRYAQKRDDKFVFRLQFGWRTLHWSRKTVRTPAMWCISLVRITNDGADRRPSKEALQCMSPLHYGKVVR